MTIIQPKKEQRPRLVHSVLFCLSVLLIGGVVWLILLYNSRVNLTHEVDSLSLAIKRLETGSAELKGSIFKLFEGPAREVFAKDRGLIIDTRPEYFTDEMQLPQQWELASHY